MGIVSGHELRDNSLLNEPRDFDFDADGVPVWKGELPETCKRAIVNDVLKFASIVATCGIPENADDESSKKKKTTLKGFLLIVGDADKLMNGSLGSCGNLNKYNDLNVSISAVVSKEGAEAMEVVLPDLMQDKAIVICGKTGRMLAHKWAVTDIRKGLSVAGTKLQAASAIAQEHCFSLKCSEDSCSCDGLPNGDFNIFPGTRDYVRVPVRKAVELEKMKEKCQRLGVWPKQTTLQISFDPEGAPCWNCALPHTCNPDVVNDMLKLASRIATKGIGEKTPAKGFLLILGDACKLMSGPVGIIGEFNKYKSNNIHVREVLQGDEALTFVLPDFIMNKAIIICGQTGRFLANQFVVTDISRGLLEGGTMLQAASAAALTGCFSIMCPMESCSCDGRPLGNFNLFPGTREYRSTPVCLDNSPAALFEQLTLALQDKDFAPEPSSEASALLPGLPLDSKVAESSTSCLFLSLMVRRTTSSVKTMVHFHTARETGCGSHGPIGPLSLEMHDGSEHEVKVKIAGWEEIKKLRWWHAIGEATVTPLHTGIFQTDDRLEVSIDGANVLKTVIGDEKQVICIPQEEDSVPAFSSGSSAISRLLHGIGLQKSDFPYMSVKVIRKPGAIQTMVQLHCAREAGCGLHWPIGPLPLQFCDGIAYEVKVTISGWERIQKFRWSHSVGNATVMLLHVGSFQDDDAFAIDINGAPVLMTYLQGGSLSTKCLQDGWSYQAPSVEGFDKDGSPVWSPAWNMGMHLPENCSQDVVNSTLKLASRVATKGIGEKTCAKGFLIIIGDRERLLGSELGTYGRYNKYCAIDINVLNMDAEAMTFVLPDFGMDKAMVICGVSGRILANKFMVADTSSGDPSTGGKHQAASAIAQKGFFALKCSEDACSVDGRASGNFQIFPGTYRAIEVAVKR